ncbi:MAG: glycosyltransferase family 1 protein [Marinilabiliales bacterium]|nr:MAG: glycosyltransferase family 1 protein [Marinilabiliales bacterium]
MTGIQRFSDELCKSLIKTGNEVIVLAPKKIRPEYKLDCKIERFGVFRGVLWEHLCLLFFLIKRKKPLLLNFGSPGPLFYKNRIVTIHDISFKHNPAWFAWYYSLYYRLITPIFAKRSKKIITVSEFSKSEIQKWLKIPDSKFIIIHNVVSDSLLNAKDTENPVKNSKYFLTVSSLDPRKNLRSIFKAFEELKPENTELVLACGKSSMFNFKDDVNSNIKSIGYVSDDELASLYKNATAFIYLSLYEGFGIPPLEAMSFGCPVILSDIPVFREIYDDAAIFVKPDDISAIKNVINSVLNDERLRNKLIRKGYEKAEEFSWDGESEVVVNVLK